MRKYIQRILFLLSLVLLVAALWLCLPRGGQSSPPARFVVILFLLGIGLQVLLAVRILILRKKVNRFLQQLIKGNYEVGVSVHRRCADEICEVEQELDRLVERLRTYDRLRADRVRRVQNCFDVLRENIAEPVMVAEIDRGSMECNSAFRTLFGLAGKDPAFSAVRKLEANAEFAELVETAIETKKPVEGEQVRLQMKPADLSKELRLRLIPVNDKDNEVRTLVVIVIDDAASHPAATG